MPSDDNDILDPDLSVLLRDTLKRVQSQQHAQPPQQQAQQLQQKQQLQPDDETPLDLRGVLNNNLPQGLTYDDSQGHSQALSSMLKQVLASQNTDTPFPELPEAEPPPSPEETSSGLDLFKHGYLQAQIAERTQQAIDEYNNTGQWNKSLSSEIAALQAEADAIPKGDALTQFGQGGFSALPVSEIPDLIGEAAATSAFVSGKTILASMAASASAGALIGSAFFPGIGTAKGAAIGAVIGAVTAAFTTFDSETEAAFSQEFFGEYGADPNKPETIKKVLDKGVTVDGEHLSGKEALDRAYTRARLKGSTIAIFDLVTFGITGRFVGAFKALQQAQKAAEAGNEGAKSVVSWLSGGGLRPHAQGQKSLGSWMLDAAGTGVGSGLSEGTGEALSQLLAYGEVNFDEALLEAAVGPVYAGAIGLGYKGVQKVHDARDRKKVEAFRKRMQTLTAHRTEKGNFVERFNALSEEDKKPGSQAWRALSAEAASRGFSLKTNGQVDDALNLNLDGVLEAINKGTLKPEDGPTLLMLHVAALKDILTIADTLSKEGKDVPASDEVLLALGVRVEETGKTFNKIQESVAGALSTGAGVLSSEELDSIRDPKLRELYGSLGGFQARQRQRALDDRKSKLQTLNDNYKKPEDVYEFSLHAPEAGPLIRQGQLPAGYTVRNGEVVETRDRDIATIGAELEAQRGDLVYEVKAHALNNEYSGQQYLEAVLADASIAGSIDFNGFLNEEFLTKHFGEDTGRQILSYAHIVQSLVDKGGRLRSITRALSNLGNVIEGEKAVPATTLRTHLSAALASVETPLPYEDVQKLKSAITGLYSQTEFQALDDALPIAYYSLQPNEKNAVDALRGPRAQPSAEAAGGSYPSAAIAKLKADNALSNAADVLGSAGYEVIGNQVYKKLDAAAQQEQTQQEQTPQVNPGLIAANEEHTRRQKENAEVKQAKEKVQDARSVLKAAEDNVAKSTNASVEEQVKKRHAVDKAKSVLSTLQDKANKTEASVHKKRGDRSRKKQRDKIMKQLREAIETAETKLAVEKQYRKEVRKQQQEAMNVAKQKAEGAKTPATKRRHEKLFRNAKAKKKELVDKATATMKALEQKVTSLTKELGDFEKNPKKIERDVPPTAKKKASTKKKNTPLLQPAEQKPKPAPVPQKPEPAPVPQKPEPAPETTADRAGVLGSVANIQSEIAQFREKASGYASRKRKNNIADFAIQLYKVYDEGRTSINNASLNAIHESLRGLQTAAQEEKATGMAERIKSLADILEKRLDQKATSPRSAIKQSLLYNLKRQTNVDNRSVAEVMTAINKDIDSFEQTAKGRSARSKEADKNRPFSRIEEQAMDLERQIMGAGDRRFATEEEKTLMVKALTRLRDILHGEGSVIRDIIKNDIDEFTRKPKGREAVTTDSSERTEPHTQATNKLGNGLTKEQRQELFIKASAYSPVSKAVVDERITLDDLRAFIRTADIHYRAREGNKLRASKAFRDQLDAFLAETRGEDPPPTTPTKKPPNNRSTIDTDNIESVVEGVSRLSSVARRVEKGNAAGIDMNRALTETMTSLLAGEVEGVTARNLFEGHNRLNNTAYNYVINELNAIIPSVARAQHELTDYLAEISDPAIAAGLWSNSEQNTFISDVKEVFAKQGAQSKPKIRKVLMSEIEKRYTKMLKRYVSEAGAQVEYGFRHKMQRKAGRNAVLNGLLFAFVQQGGNTVEKYLAGQVSEDMIKKAVQKALNAYLDPLREQRQTRAAPITDTPDTPDSAEEQAEDIETVLNVDTDSILDTLKNARTPPQNEQTGKRNEEAKDQDEQPQNEQPSDIYDELAEDSVDLVDLKRHLKDLPPSEHATETLLWAVQRDNQLKKMGIKQSAAPIEQDVYTFIERQASDNPDSAEEWELVREQLSALNAGDTTDLFNVTPTQETTRYENNRESTRLLKKHTLTAREATRLLERGNVAEKEKAFLLWVHQQTRTGAGKKGKRVDLHPETEKRVENAITAFRTALRQNPRSILETVSIYLVLHKILDTGGRATSAGYIYARQNQKALRALIQKRLSHLRHGKLKDIRLNTPLASRVKGGVLGMFSSTFNEATIYLAEFSNTLNNEEKLSKEIDDTLIEEVFLHGGLRNYFSDIETAAWMRKIRTKEVMQSREFQTVLSIYQHVFDDVVTQTGKNMAMDIVTEEYVAKFLHNRNKRTPLPTAVRALLTELANRIGIDGNINSDTLGEMVGRINPEERIVQEVIDAMGQKSADVLSHLRKTLGEDVSQQLDTVQKQDEAEKLLAPITTTSQNFTGRELADLDMRTFTNPKFSQLFNLTTTKPNPRNRDAFDAKNVADDLYRLGFSEADSSFAAMFNATLSNTEQTTIEPVGAIEKAGNTLKHGSKSVFAHAVMSTAPIPRIPDLVHAHYKEPVGALAGVASTMAERTAEIRADAVNVVGHLETFTKGPAVDSTRSNLEFLSDFAHDMTLANATENFLSKHKSTWSMTQLQLAKRYEQLGAEGQKAYHEMLDFYDRYYTESVEQSIAQLKSIEELKDEESIDELRDQLLARKRKYYVPLVRLGDYSLGIKTKDGEVVHYERFATYAEQIQAEQEARAQYGEDHEILTSKLTETERKGDGAAVHILSQARDKLRKKLDDATPDTLDDEELSYYAEIVNSVMKHLDDLALAALPDTSLQKRQMKRKGVPGFNNDVLVNFSDTAEKITRQIPSIQYRGEALKQLRELHTRIKSAPLQGDNATPMSKALAQAAYDTFHAALTQAPPNKHSALLVAKGLNFFLALGFNVSSATVNLTQNFLMGYPILSRDSGVVDPVVAMMKAYKDVSQGVLSDFSGYVTDSYRSMGDSLTKDDSLWTDILTEDEVSAIQEAIQKGVITQTFADVLTEHNSIGPKTGAALVQKIGAYPFHGAEVYTRTVFLLAAYRLARGRGLDHTAAVENAKELTKQAHYDYSHENKPRLIKHPLSDAMLAFMNYRLNATYRNFVQLKNATQAITKGKLSSADEATRQEGWGAVREFGTQVGMILAFSGIAGLPLPVVFVAKIVQDAVSALSGDVPEDERPAFEDQMRADIFSVLEPLGEDNARTLTEIAINGPISTLTGMDISHRTSMATLLFSLPYEYAYNNRSQWQNFVGQFFGPIANYAVRDIPTGLDYIERGQYQRGIESMIPNVAMRNAMKAWRYAQEGVGTPNFPPKISVPPEDISVRELLQTSLGLGSPAIAHEYRQDVTKRNYTRQLQNKRSNLLAKYRKAVLAKDTGGVDKIMQDMVAWNKRWPDMAISRQTLRKTVRSAVRGNKTWEHKVPQSVINRLRHKKK